MRAIVNVDMTDDGCEGKPYGKIVLTVSKNIQGLSEFGQVLAQVAAKYGIEYSINYDADSTTVNVEVRRGTEPEWLLEINNFVNFGVRPKANLRVVQPIARHIANNDYTSAICGESINPERDLGPDVLRVATHEMLEGICKKCLLTGTVAVKVKHD